MATLPDFSCWAALTPAPPSRLLALPAELRNQTLEYVIITRHPITGEKKTITMQSLLLAHSRLLRNHCVCKKYHIEASNIFWGQNVFKIEQSSSRAAFNSSTRTDWDPRVIFFKGLAFRNSLQVKLFGHYKDKQHPGPRAFALLLPPRKYISKIKEIELNVPVCCSGAELLSLPIVEENEGPGAWLWSIKNLKELGFEAVEAVTIKFLGDFDAEKKEALERYVSDAEIDSKKVKVVFEFKVVKVTS